MGAASLSVLPLFVFSAFIKKSSSDTSSPPEKEKPEQKLGDSGLVPRPTNNLDWSIYLWDGAPEERPSTSQLVYHNSARSRERRAAKKRWADEVPLPHLNRLESLVITDALPPQGLLQPHSSPRCFSLEAIGSIPAPSFPSEKSLSLIWGQEACFCIPQEINHDSYKHNHAYRYPFAHFQTRGGDGCIHQEICR